MQKIYKVGLAVMAALSLLYAFQGYYPDFIGVFSNAFSPLISGVTVIVSGFSLERYWRESKGKFSMVWLYFTAGLFLWFMGEAVWAGYTLVLGVELPYPSAADVFWLAGYVPFLIGLCWYVKLFSSALTWKRLTATLIAIFAFVVLAMALLVPPIFETEENLITRTISLAYPILDFVLFGMAHLGLIIFWRGNIGKSWLLINAAIATNACADIIFSYTTAKGIYYNGHPADLLFDFAYLFFLMAFYIHTKEL
ncbi:hypothetical protein KEJ45_06935 [Candidatus Bathyarchaeota archaeon]|nr:hypothetical protein [Candidatus Bathyarchaeota archaeon]